MIKINLFKPKAIIHKGRLHNNPPEHFALRHLEDIYIEAARDYFWRESQRGKKK